MGFTKWFSSFFIFHRLPINQMTGAVFENEALQFWRVYFDFSYYLLLFPFHFSWSSFTGDYEISSSTVQKILSIIVRVLTALYFTMKLRYMYLIDGSENPTKYFELAYYFCDTIYQTSIFILISKERKGIQSVFRELQESNGIYCNNPYGYLKTRLITRIICGLCIGTVFLYIIEILMNENWDMASYINFYRNDSKTVFIAATGFADKNISISDHHPAVMSITILSIFSNFMEKILNTYSDILFVMTCLMFHYLSKQFCLALKDTNETPVHVIDHYHWLKSTTEKINETTSIITVSFVVGNLPFYATNILDVYRDPNIFRRLRYLFYCFYFFPALFLAAKSSRDIDNIKTWICNEKNYSAINPAKLAVFLQELNFQSIGISSFGCINVNYGMVGSIVSIILTYALLKTQFQGVAANLSTDTSGT